MMRIKLLIAVLIVPGLHALVSAAVADVFGSGSNEFEMEFVTIGKPGNPADTAGQPNPAGSVDYFYRIAKYEVSEQMIDTANTLGGLGITKDTRGPNKPATSVDWFEAAKFVNWLNTSTGRTPAYKFVDIVGRNGQVIGTEFALWEPSDAGYDPDNLFRNRFARYFLPSVDEWYKSAYYDPVAGVYWNYATGSNSPPTAVASGTDPGTAVLMQDATAGPADITHAGGLNPYGTMAQAGNVSEWEETEIDLLNNNAFAFRGIRGAAWSAFASSSSSSNRFGNLPQISGAAGGVRVASIIPEPSTTLLAAFTFLGALLGKRRSVLCGRRTNRSSARGKRLN
jgi:formylglycine-generating enzyme